MTMQQHLAETFYELLFSLFTYILDSAITHRMQQKKFEHQSY